MSNISKTSQTLYDETWTIWTTQPTQLVCEIREKSVRAFSSKSWFIFYGLILVIPTIFSNISRKKNLTLSLFSWKVFYDSETFLMYIERPRCSIKEIEVYLLCEILISKDTLQGQKKLLRASLISFIHLNGTLVYRNFHECEGKPGFLQRGF